MPTETVTARSAFDAIVPAVQSHLEQIRPDTRQMANIAGELRAGGPGSRGLAQFEQAYAELPGSIANSLVIGSSAMSSHVLAEARRGLEAVAQELGVGTAFNAHRRALHDRVVALKDQLSWAKIEEALR